MLKVTFARNAAANAFASMAEGMWENHRDDAVLGDTASQENLERWSKFVDCLNSALADKTESPVTIELSEWFESLIKDVADNCADNAHDMGIDSEFDLEEQPEDAAMACGDWEVTIEHQIPIPPPELGTQEALEIALQALDRRAAETDTASPEGHSVREAHKMITALLEQEGCEHFDSALKDGKLTTLCDLVIFG